MKGKKCDMDHDVEHEYRANTGAGKKQAKKPTVAASKQPKGKKVGPANAPKGRQMP